MHVSLISDGLHVFVTVDIYQKTENSKKWPYRKGRNWNVTPWHVQGITRSS